MNIAIRHGMSVLFLMMLVVSRPLPLWAKGAGSSAALILFDPVSARTSALGDAASALTGDVAGFAFNPATVRTLTSPQALFTYQRGLADDARGRLMIGAPKDCGGIGFNVNYYDGGNVRVVNGTDVRDVKAKSDLVISVGAARSIGKANIGLAGKYIHSEVIEQEKATAMAFDVGITAPLHSRLSAGASLQNIGTTLKYLRQREDLPRIARLGLQWKALQGQFPTTLFFDAPYYMNEQELRTGAGAETGYGPLALRIGYKSIAELTNFSFGAGFSFKKYSIDYSYGLVSDVRDEHNISFNMKFGRGS